MGTVWRATDTTLDRDVALKMLPEAMASNAQHYSRFEREAKVLAALNHPNVAQVYSVHEVDSTRFLAMELVPGEDLSERLARGPLEPEEAIRVMCRVADGVEAAHAKGVIHRDLKPANVRLTPDGAVKVLDFGLAKAMPDQPAASEGSDPPANILETTAGVVLGTVPYMSPEQARCQALEVRSDIWAFGCILFECLTGERPFRGETIGDVLAAILKAEPDWSRLPETTPPRIRKVLRRCLAKEPGRRFHHIADARIELEDAEQDARHTGLPDAAPEPRGPSRALFAAAVAAAVAGVTLLLVNLTQEPKAGRPSTYVSPLATAQFHVLTNWPGAEFDAAISPDGRNIVFVSDRDGRFEIYAGEIDSREFRKIAPEFSGDATHPVRNVGFVDNGTIWIGGGMHVDTGSDTGMSQLSLLGGTPRSVLPRQAVNADWTPDGRVVYHWGTHGDPMFIAEGRGVDPQPIPVPTQPGYHQHHPTWSLDGSWIYAVRGWVTSREVDLWRLRPDGSALEQLTWNKPMACYPAPLDGRTLLYCALDERGSGPWLYALDLETKTSHNATIGAAHYSSVSASEDGRRVIATVVKREASLFTVPIRDSVATETDAEPLAIGAARALAPRIRGEDLFFLSSRAARDGLWRYRDGQVSEIWKGSETALLEPAAVSPDGRYAALTIRKPTQTRLWRVEVSSGVSKRLAGVVTPRGAADWSPDGKWIVVGGSVMKQAGLYLINVETDEVKRIVEGEAVNPVWSPTGDVIVYVGEQVNAWTPVKAIRADDYQPIELPDLKHVQANGERVRFLPDGSGFVYMSGQGAGKDFYLLDLETKKSRRLTRLDMNTKMRTFDVTSDGKRIVFDRLRWDADIVMFERDATPGD